jgi:hypothetical protein
VKLALPAAGDGQAFDAGSNFLAHSTYGSGEAPANQKTCRDRSGARNDKNMSAMVRRPLPEAEKPILDCTTNSIVKRENRIFRGRWILFRLSFRVRCKSRFASKAS